MTSIVIDRLHEEDFRRSIENRLREKQAGAAIERLRRLLQPYAGPGGILPERFLSVSTADFALSGWEELDESIRRHDRPESPITAISIAFGWPGEEPRARNPAGHFAPYLETRYFTDASFPFSESTRDDLLDGYSSYGCIWGDDCEALDTALAVDGIDDLHTALTELEEELLATDDPDEDRLRAGSLGACLLSALLVQAVSEQIEQHRLPRPLCVMSGSSGVYPFFDAPVIGMPEAPRKARPEPLETAIQAMPAAPAPPMDPAQAAPAYRYSSLLMTGIPRARKRAVLVLEEDADEMTSRIARLRGNGMEPPVGEPAAANDQGPQDLPDPAQPWSNHFEAPPAGLILPDPTGTSPLLVKKHPGKALSLDSEIALPAPAAPEPASPDAAAPEPQEDEPAQQVEPWADLFAPQAAEAELPEFEEPVAETLPVAQIPPVAEPPIDPQASLKQPARHWSERLRAGLAAARSVLSQLLAFYRGRKGPPPPPRKRFPPR